MNAREYIVLFEVKVTAFGEEDAIDQAQMQLAENEAEIQKSPSLGYTKVAVTGLDKGKCFSCDRELSSAETKLECETSDGQRVLVGSKCFSKIKKAGASGFQPSLGGPKLYEVR